jgi:lipopolysaccharide transport system permease protein
MPDVIIGGSRHGRRCWRDLWHYRELFEVPAWRDLSVRHKHNAGGVLWDSICPLLTMLIFAVICGRIAKTAF